MLGKLWRAFTGAADPAMPRRGQVQYITFVVEDPEAARTIRAWRDGRAAASKAIGSYIKDLHSATLGGPWVTVHYCTDEKTGSLSKIAYAGHVPPGWSAEKGTYDNWLVPDHRARQDLARLPAMPSFAALAAQIGWPVLPEAGTRTERDFAARFNHLPVVHEKNGFLFIDLPHPSNFSERPALEKTLYAWDAPPFMRPVDRRRGARDPFMLP